MNRIMDLFKGGDNMKTAIVFGASGNFGSEMVKALSEQKWQVKVFKRLQSKSQGSEQHDEMVHGDINSESDVTAAIKDVDLIVYALNPPYTQWRECALSSLESVCSAAEKLNKHILFPGNVYSLPTSPNVIDEKVPLSSTTVKGEIRIEMEQRLQEASQNGAKVTIVRAGDYIGVNGQWFNLIFKPKGTNWKMSAPHEASHQHYWSYLPNLCYNAAQLVEQRTAQTENKTTHFEVFHDPGVVATTQDWVNAFQQQGIALRVSSFPWWAITVSSVFVPMFKEVLEMRYLWQKPLVLDGSKLIKTLGSTYKATTLSEVVEQTVSKNASSITQPGTRSSVA
jgi:nucleoside-diphosphate-sugar epimerase